MYNMHLGCVVFDGGWGGGRGAVPKVETLQVFATQTCDYKSERNEGVGRRLYRLQR